MRLWRYLDFYLTLFLAVVIGTLGVFDLASTGVIAGATLATLGVLTSGTFTGRLQLRRLHDTTAELTALTREGLSGPPSADRLLTTSPAGPAISLGAATEIAVIGVTLSRTLRNHLHELRACLHRGGVVRIAVIDPAGGTIAEAARRSTVPDHPEIFAHRLRPSIDLLRELALSAGPGRLEVRLISFVPAVGLLMTDPDEAHGQVRVDIYSHRFAVAEPTLTLLAHRDPVWYRHFRLEFEQIWSTGHPVDAPAAITA